MRLFDCCKPDWLNSTLLLSSKRPCISCTLLLCSALLAIRLAQRSRLNRRAIHSSSSTEITQRSLSWAAWLSLAYAVMGEKDSALKLAERAIVLLPRAKDQRTSPGRESGVNSDDLRREQPCDLNSRAAVTNAIFGHGLLRQRPLRRPFLGSIRSGTHCAPIPLSKSSARKSNRESWAKIKFAADCKDDTDTDLISEEW